MSRRGTALPGSNQFSMSRYEMEVDGGSAGVPEAICSRVNQRASSSSLLPLAADVTHPVAFMAVSGEPDSYRSALQREVTALLAPELLPGQSAEPVERFAFYARARAAYAIVLTGEKQPFGNFILRKGVIGENLRP